MVVFDGEGGSGVEGGSGAAPDRDIVVSLTAMLDSCNALVRQFRMIRVSRERVELAGAPFRLRIVGSSSDDPRVYSPPTAPELAALIDKLRSETYQGITDAVGQGSASGRSVGVKVVLPSGFGGSKRSEPGQKPADRPDIVSRVFKMKLDQLYVLYTVEFQKRGLPHAHMLVWLDRQQQRTDEIIGEASAQLIDGIVSAELPDVLEDPLAYALVDEFMVHGPCGRMNGKCPCMKDGVCSKRFPKSFCEETHVDQSGYPIYRRRADGRTIVKDGHILDNRWVVPHNVALLKRYQAHMNVEWCNKTNLVKYLFKYITKGPDRANVAVCPVGGSSTGQQPEEGVDEVAEYKSCRYLSVCESFWRLYSFDIHVRTPSVERLEIHLPGMNRVTYSEDANLGDIVLNDNYRKSTLTEWRWVKRGRGHVLGRVRHVDPTTGELFYLRMLLMSVRGAQSFEDLKRHMGVTYSTFREDCRARGLLGDDSEWSRVFDETVVWATASQLRNLFVTILMFCDVGDAGKLFDRYWKYLVDDILYIRRKALQNQS
ncbi:hypothetical protein ACQ4PT_003685 [Festuca glaucescens]